jgi:uncharacterized protein (TIGR02117 family)
MGNRRSCRLLSRAGPLALAVALVTFEPGFAAARMIDEDTSSGPERSVYLVSHGWHVGLVLRRDDVAAASWPEKEAVGPFRYLEVGWGDGDYYPARRGTIPLALRAAFRSRWSVLQVVGFNGSVTETFPRSKVLHVLVSPDGLDALARYIHRSHAEDPDGHPIIVAPAHYGFGFFALARGRYHLLDNSNTWTARALKVAGCPIDVDAALTAGAVLHQAVRFSRVVRPGLLLRASDDVPMRCERPPSRPGILGLAKIH